MILAKMLSNGDQKMAKTFQMATKTHPKRGPNRGQAGCAGMVDNIFSVFEFLGRFWEPFGSQFGAKSPEKTHPKIRPKINADKRSKIMEKGSENHAKM